MSISHRCPIKPSASDPRSRLWANRSPARSRSLAYPPRSASSMFVVQCVATTVSAAFTTRPLLPLRGNLTLPDRKSRGNQSGVLHEQRGERFCFLDVFRVVGFELLEVDLGTCLILRRQLGLRPVCSAVTPTALDCGSGICVPGDAAVVLDLPRHIGNLRFLRLSILQDGFRLDWQPGN